MAALFNTVYNPDHPVCGSWWYSDSHEYHSRLCCGLLIHGETAEEGTLEEIKRRMKLMLGLARVCTICFFAITRHAKLCERCNEIQLSKVSSTVVLTNYSKMSRTSMKEKEAKKQ